MLDNQLPPHCLSPAISVTMPRAVGPATSIRAVGPTDLDSGSGACFLPLAGLWAAWPPLWLPPHSPPPSYPPPCTLLSPWLPGSKGHQVRPFAVPAAFPLSGDISGETLARKASSEGKAPTFRHQSPEPGCAQAVNEV